MRARGVFLCAFFASSVAYAQAPAQPLAQSLEKCTGNFEEAQLKERRGKLVEAEELYAACADPKCPSMIRADCTAKHDDVARRVPTITVVVRDASGKDLDTKIDIDGQPVADRLHLRPIDPGEHVIHYRIDGQQPVAEPIAIVEGEKARVITLTAKAPPSSAKPASAGTGDDAPSKASTIGPIVLGGGGVLLIGVGVYLVVHASGESDTADEYDATADSPATSAVDREAYRDAAKSKRDSASNSRSVGIVAASAGVLAIGGAVTWYLLTHPSKKAAAFAPVVTPTYAGAAFDLRF